MSALNALAGGVFATSAPEDDDTDLRRLVEELGAWAFDARPRPRSLPEQFDDALWDQLEQTGLSRLTSTPDLEAGPSELAIVLRGLARHAAAVPIAETELAAWLAGRAGQSLPDGPLTVAIADADIDGGRITGTATEVPWARIAHAVVLAARTDKAVHVGVLRGLNVDEHYNVAGEPSGRLTFDILAGDLTQLDPAVGHELVRRGAWTRCVQIVGNLDAAAALAVAHTRHRIQFGRPLNAFQSVQQALAAMAGEIERARAATTLAVAAASDFGFAAHQTDYAVSVAKVVAGQAVPAVCTIAHQLHGAIGVTLEHPLPLFTMRSQSAITDYGSTGWHARRLGRMAFASDKVWDVVVGNDVTGWE
ncbi:MAG TPA: acyl-CoA dehydrogenase family protein [Mycobacterium sp.]|nr:acyl-CoA dehydrogenase family protein [Mycobacterium sp.]